MDAPAFPSLPVPPGLRGLDVVAASLRDLLAGRRGGFRLVASRAGIEPAGGPDDAPADVVVPTSGSTGEPRGVVLSREALIASADLGAAALGPPGAWLTALPLTGVGGLLTVVRSLRAGHVPEAWPGIGGAASFTAASFTESATGLLQRTSWVGQPAYVSLVPTQLHRILQDAGATAAAAAFHRILVGGAPLAGALADRARAAGLRIVATYGASETGGGVVYDGLPLPGVGVEIVDGLVEVSGPTVATGYLDGPRFGGVVRTHDRGEWVDGRLQILGRDDQVVKVGGRMVSLSAITRILLDDPRVLDAVVVAGESEEWGAVPQAFVVAAPPTPADLVDSLTALVAWELGPGHRPHTMTVVPDLPVNAAGKPLLRDEP